MTPVGAALVLAGAGLAELVVYLGIIRRRRRQHRGYRRAHVHIGGPEHTHRCLPFDGHVHPEYRAERGE